MLNMANPVVNVRCGPLRGSVQKSCESFDYYAFKGIPYAKPPVGELRFRDPIPVESWLGTRDALEFGPIAAQYELMAKTTESSEDCLFLNVYTRTLETSERQPVMFWIHGGGFIYGSGNDSFYGPDYLLKRNVVLVTFNYRLGVLGFLNLEDEVAPGNQGLKDQVVALQWVQYNIEKFGGDPGNVTIFGESAGGSSVHYLTMSPLAKGLFHKAISQSGVALNPWAAVYGDPKIYAYKLCSLLGKDTEDPEEIVEFLRTIDTKKLIEVQGMVGHPEVKNKCFGPFGPGVDSMSPRPFLPVPREIAAQKGANVPYIIGMNDLEGILLMGNILNKDDSEKINRRLEDYLHPEVYDMLKSYNLIEKELRSLYCKGEKITQENFSGFIDLVTDVLFTHGIHKVLKIQVERNSASTYFYQFTYDLGPSLPRIMGNSTYPGAAHMDELLYLFNMKFFETENKRLIKKGSEHHLVMQQMVEMWTDFAKTGRPTPKITGLIPLYWQPCTDGTVIRYLKIDENLRMQKVLNIEERYNFNKNLY